MFGLAVFGQPAVAQNAVFDSGDTVVTGFSGVKPPEGAPPPAGNPLDEFFIDPQGAAMKVFKAGTPAQPQAQLLNAPAGFTIPASETGQVFAVTLDENPDGVSPPNIYLGATSVFGLNIVTPDTDGDGRPERAMQGAPGATWMDGQFGVAKGGTPGAIYKVDSATGQVSLFASLPANSGPGIGDIVFDKATQQFFASDLDTGLIHRIDASGAVLDSFDHGTMGRPAAGLAPLPDDGSALDVTSPAFDATNPATWAFTPRERMVWGMTMHAGRLYYAVQGSLEIWSVGIGIDGAFANDARLEFKVEGLAGDTYISDMLFDAKGQLYLAQRGEFRGSYDYSVFAEPQRSDVLRYRQEMPDDPATPGTWVPVPESYAIGFPEGHKNASGGIALDRCEARTLWTTGDNLRNNPAYEAQLAAGGPLEVHGLQGNSIDLVRPQNEPPLQSVFLDYDGQFGDPEKAGHVGDVETWQPCKEQSGDAGYYIPSYGDLPPDYTPPAFDSFNLELRKRAVPHDCWHGGLGWRCHYIVRVRNAGTTPYLGTITVHDTVSDLPAGSVLNFAFQPPWNCNMLAFNEYRCKHSPVFLLPGHSVDLHVFVNMPVTPHLCHLPNVATLEWPWGWGDSNPADDADWANANVPDPSCHPQGDRTDLKIEKTPYPGCTQNAGGYACHYLIKVTNVGPGQYNGQIRITDTVPPGTTATFFGGPMWNACPGGPATYTCTRNPQLLNPGQSVFLFARVNVPLAAARDLHCHVKNDTHIVLAPGGTAQNTNPTNDDASATANIPQEICNDTQPHTNLRLDKRADSEGCVKGAGDTYHCRYTITVTNTGPGVYNGQLTVQDTIPTGTTVNFAAGGWTCTNMAPYTCTRNVNLPSGGTVELGAQINVPENVGMHLQCHVLNRARITVAPGGTPSNTNPSDDTEQAAANIPNLCNQPVPTNLLAEKRAGACTRKQGGWECSYIITVRNTGPGHYNRKIELAETLPAQPMNATWNAPWNCTSGGGGTATCTHPVTMIPPGGTRVLNLKATFSDSMVRQHNCHLLNQVQITHVPGGTPENTDAGDDHASATATVPAWFCQPVVKDVTPPPPPPSLCPPGYFWNGKNCELPGCPRGEYLNRGHCCPFGKVWNGENCEKPHKPDCPPRWTGKWPVCCPPGVLYRNGQCLQKPQDDCKPGYHKSQGQCCPKGTEWNLRLQRCTTGSEQNDCKPGYHKSQGQCCPKGTEWNLRLQRCTTGSDDGIRDCPKGTHGKFPLCVPDSLCKPGQHMSQGHCCPKGTDWNARRQRCITGTSGNDDASNSSTKVCPKGTIGKYPNCRSIGVICTGGKVFKRGHCVSLQDKPKIKDILKLEKDRAKRLQPIKRLEIQKRPPQLNRMPQGGTQVR